MPVESPAHRATRATVVPESPCSAMHSMVAPINSWRRRASRGGGAFPEAEEGGGADDEEEGEADDEEGVELEGLALVEEELEERTFGDDGSDTALPGLGRGDTGGAPRLGVRRGQSRTSIRFGGGEPKI